MHQQVRCVIKQQSDGTRGELEEASLVEILKLLSGTNLRSAGRVHADGGGEFVFSVQHDKDDDDIPTRRLATSSRRRTTRPGYTRSST